jgi:tRNA-2-methylthio-N6-dimethylallyladenosine synthase
LSMVAWANFTMSYMFFYSERPGTLAARKFPDDIPEITKKARLQDVIRLQNQLSAEHNKAAVGKIHEVLIEGNSKKSDQDFCGRNTQNQMLVFPKKGDFKPGDYVRVNATSASFTTILGEIV